MKKHLDMILIAAALLAVFCLMPSDADYRKRNIAIAAAAAEKGDVQSQAYMAACYFYGHCNGTAKEFLKWANLAAAQNDHTAELLLGFYYVNTVQDVAEGVKWARRSAEGGHPRGERFMGYLYSHGIGVPHDPVEANKWFRKAAAKNDWGAQRNLGIVYAHGEGVARDNIEAAKWYGEAGKHGDTLALFQSIAYFFKEMGREYDDIGLSKDRKVFRLETLSGAKPHYGLVDELSRLFPAGTHKKIVEDFLVRQESCVFSDDVLVTRIASTGVKDGNSTQLKLWIRKRVSEPGYEVYYYKSVDLSGMQKRKSPRGWFFVADYNAKDELKDAIHISSPYNDEEDQAEMITLVERLLLYKAEGYPKDPVDWCFSGYASTKCPATMPEPQ